MPKSNFSVSSLLNSSTTTSTNTNNNSAIAANVTANYFNFLNKFRPIGFPSPLSTSRGLLAPPPPIPPPPSSLSTSSSSTSSSQNPQESIHRTQDDGVHDDPKVELESKDLWDQFHQHGTEMVRSRLSCRKENFSMFLFRRLSSLLSLRIEKKSKSNVFFSSF